MGQSHWTRPQVIHSCVAGVDLTVPTPMMRQSLEKQESARESASLKGLGRRMR